MKHENKIVTLFEAENGLWGTKDAEGNVFDEPVYERFEALDDREYFYDNKNGVECEFSPSGFVTKEFFGSNIVSMFSELDFPEKYNHYIWNKLHEHFDDWGAGDRAAAKAIKTLNLDDVQKRVLEDIYFYYYWDMLCNTCDNDTSKQYKDFDWIKSNIHHISADLRISSLVPVMESERLTDEEKAMIWYGNFCVIQNFDDRYRMDDDDDDDKEDIDCDEEDDESVPEIITLPENFDEFVEMVRNRPVPDTPGYYHLSVYAFNSRNKYEENLSHQYMPDDKPVEFERHIDQGNVNFRIPVNCDCNGVEPLGADYATCAEAIVDMCKIIGKDGVFGFIISRYGFGQLAHNRFLIEEWMYDAQGQLVQHSSCSSYHYNMPGMFGKFFGHDTLPYKTGDKVMILHRYVGDTQLYACPGIIVYETDDLKKGYESYVGHIEDWVSKGNSPETWADATDYLGSDEDEYFVQYGSYDPHEIHFSFQSPTRIFPLPFALPKEIEREMDNWYREYKIKNEDL